MLRCEVRRAIFFGDVPASEMVEYGHLEIQRVASMKGRGGRVYSVFETKQGLVAFWPLASGGPRLGPFYKRATAAIGRKKK